MRHVTNYFLGSGGVRGKLLFMGPLGSETIPDNVPAKQNGSGWQVGVVLSQPVHGKLLIDDHRGPMREF